MFEHLPRWLGKALSPFRAGADKLAIVRPELAGEGVIHLASPAFANGARLPDRFTADGEGSSPPLFWTSVPEGTARLVLIVEDPDAPTPQPVVHAIVWGLPIDGDLKQGEIAPDGEGNPEGEDVGRNSRFVEGWLPPDPPNGHGEHSYAFQLFALSEGEDPGENPGRGAILRAMEGRVIAAGLLTGTYSRGEQAPIGPVGAGAAA
ncbi:MULTISPECIES: YbhB/YbcL family Raf kinase inhibitor-like protein [unclassified Sphingomonas]|uniref:YbhB/YbcL family Raf kinase inhibitor-like protein n=1 Tax=Sphingomonas TaxID=13687 RepID=UPI000967F98D|nr:MULTISPECIES: YbhB/YbcL family Raf kinase inhibitor-like protein [unclassified Sphingomonas]MBN8809941.1 YbhB/YbcL family Raf kinase inhibitor-like protein [Sphingomonas sp.]OJY50547.1 MAG: phosphatidylethanolamine-binding protein [Sphingomonas sp. 67-41]